MCTLQKKSLISLFGGFFLLSIVSIVHLTQGQAGFSIEQLLSEVWVQGRVQDIVLGMRLPRLVIGILAGGALAVAGVILQTLTNNPLASASTLGINAGAFFAVVLVMVFFPTLLGKFPFVVALVGAIFSTILVLFLAGKELNPVRVALTGLIISLLFSSVTGALQLLFENQTSGLFLWGAGTLIQLDWTGVKFAFPFIFITVIAAIIAGKSLDTLSLGEDIASSLGQSVLKVKIFTWSLAIILASVTVSVVGVIGFIGLIAPHIVRLIGIKGHRPLIIHSFLWGSVILISADVVARLIQPGQEIPVGAMTALIGGPWLMFLAYRTAKKQKRGERSLGGTKNPLSLTWLLPVTILCIIIVLYLSFSFNGTTWTPISEWNSTIIWNFRIPRTLTAFIIGMILSISGVLFQGVLRNPLADASVLGITSLSGAGAMIFLVLFPSLSVSWLPIGAILGATVAISIIFITSWKNGFQPILVALMGISVSAFGSAVIQILVVKSKLVVAAALVWLSGSTYAKGWNDVYIALILFIILVPIAIYLTRSLNALAFGDDVATSHGLAVPKTRVIALIIGVALTTAAVSIVGTIGFIGLLAPHIARRLVGYSHLPLMIFSMLLGGFLLTFADFIGRVLLAPKEIPSGLVVTLIGAPYLLYLLKKIK
ncbi:iron ABC transporter permease [Anaerobacillus alkalidiazotrophicus]|uniref:Iron ABC transporter permease n=1 Tax=Anaerobacillus alkalidiazotrophicus TaxID=472963 RepID=A0A1S2M3N3_9BACI|nr:iron ABC transporter permease [Anaerobacillus alkalidiazotrophicus]OIJ19053.1 iron ABC transporter permease [Anaerobacillus alkalidiazotrophicus]